MIGHRFGSPSPSLHFFFEREISLIEGQTASTIDIKEKQDTIKQG